MSSEKVEKAQQALKQQGYDPGPIGGQLNPQTEAALQSFQQPSGLEPTGQLDHQTIARLGIDEYSSEQGSAVEHFGTSDNSGTMSRSEGASSNSTEISPSS